ncbi:MAG TPA: nuclear transport factor 2 family protein [Acidobacteriaceae bacterium]|nr:nuclear transport factor 2 family protein [Acidobacteriaceae bacterium]
MRRWPGAIAVSLVAFLVVVAPVAAQVLSPGASGASAGANSLSDTTIAPGKALLYDLEARFAADTAKGGGKAFATWFAEDSVSLGKGQPAVHGREAIARQATWSPKSYQLTWTPMEAVMSPAGEMGYTWGHYEGRSIDPDGNGKVTSGRYLTIWRKEPNGDWKVVLDASSDEPPAGDDCCKLPSN